jgi:hypothetical protein
VPESVRESPSTPPPHIHQAGSIRPRVSQALPSPDVALSEHFREGPLRSLAERLGDAMVLPALVALRTRLVAFTTVSHGLALVPGVLGRLMRRAWYRQTLAACGRNLVVHFGAAIRTQRSRVGDNCSIGIYNWFGWVDIGDDFMSGSHVVVLSGRRQHRFDRLDIPMRAQGGEQSCVSIGDDVWVGASVVIGADVVAAHDRRQWCRRAEEVRRHILGGVPTACLSLMHMTRMEPRPALLVALPRSLAQCDAVAALPPLPAM